MENPWNSWCFPLYFTIFTPFEKKCSPFIFFVGPQAHSSNLNLRNIALCPCDKNFPYDSVKTHVLITFKT